MSFTYIYSKAGQMNDEVTLPCHGNLTKRTSDLKLALNAEILPVQARTLPFDPPVSNHFAEDSNDFSNDQQASMMSHIIEMILKGEESMGCLPLEDARLSSILFMTGSLQKLHRKFWAHMKAVGSANNNFFAV
jgi:hypothetical protein